MSMSSSTTVSHVFPVFNHLIDKVEQFICTNDKTFTLYNAGLGCLEKLKEYYAKTDECDLYPIASSN